MAKDDWTVVSQTPATSGWEVVSQTPIKPVAEERPSLGSPMGEDFGSAIMAAAEQPKPRKTYTGSVFDTVDITKLPEPEFNPEEAARLSRRAYAEQSMLPPRKPAPELKPTPKEEIDRSIGGAAMDTVIGVLQGAVSIPKGIVDNIPFDNPLSQFYKDAYEAGEKAKTGYIRSKNLERSALLERVRENQGELAASRAAFNTMFSPSGADIVAKGAGSMVAPLGLSLFNLGTKSMVAMNALANAGDAAQQAAAQLASMSPEDWSKSDIYQSLREKGLDHRDAVRILAPMYALPAQTVGLITGAVSGATGLEKALVKGGAQAVGSRLGRAGAETLGELSETLLPMVAGNAAQRLVDDRTNILKGTGQAAIETVAGALPGSALAAAVGERKPAVPTAEQMARERGFLVTPPKAQEWTVVSQEPAVPPEAPAAPSEAGIRAQQALERLAESVPSRAATTEVPVEEGVPSGIETPEAIQAEEERPEAPPAVEPEPVVAPPAVEEPAAEEPAVEAKAPAAPDITVEPGKPFTRPQQPPMGPKPPELDESNVKRSKKPPEQGGRHPQVQAAAMLLAEGKMTREEYEKYVDHHRPIYPVDIDKLVPPSTVDAMQGALRGPEAKARLNTPIEDGTRVGLRMDLPALDKGVPVVSIHQGKPNNDPKTGQPYKSAGQVISYSNTGYIKNVTFAPRDQNKSLRMGYMPDEKNPLQTAEGKWVNMSPEEVYSKVQSLKDDPAWTQVGFDPHRHGYFYDRKTREPVASADELFQVGNFLLAKNVKYAPKTEYLYSIEPPKTESAAFKRWFGDSKIVDEDGNPLVVYHGTKREFNVFETKYPDGLFFFSTNPSFASKWPVGTGGKGDLREPPPGTEEEYNRIKKVEERLYSQYMKPSDDYDLNTKEGRDQFDSDRASLKAAVKKETGFSSAIEFEMNAGIRVMPVYLSIQKPFDPRKDFKKIEPFLAKAGKQNLIDAGYHKSGNWVIYEDKGVIDELKRQGYDGIWLAENIGGPHETIAAFSNKQIKSATGNRGTFEPTSPVITESVESEVGKPSIIIEPLAQEEKRSPSFKRTVKVLYKRLADGKISQEEFNRRFEDAIKRDEQARLEKEPQDRVRGADRIREVLLAAKRRGELSPETVELAEWFIKQNERLLDDLAISVAGKGERAVAGNYEAMTRLMTLIKDSAGEGTAVHEILHHLERMMPPEVQRAIRKEWMGSLFKASREAKTPAERLYYTALLDFNFRDGKVDLNTLPADLRPLYYKTLSQMDVEGDTVSGRDLAMQLLKNGDVNISHYQNFNPSEFWAINGTEIVKGRYNAIKGGVLARLKNWLKELGEKIKSIFGYRSDAPLIRALDSLAKADGKFVSKEMLGQGDFFMEIAPEERLEERAGLPRQKESLLVSRDELGRRGFGAGAKTYDAVAKIANAVLDKVSMKPISPELSRAMRNMKAVVAKAQKEVADVAGELGKLPEAERKMVSDVIEGELEAGVHPPQHVLNIAASMQDIMSRQSEELVRLKMLSPEAAARWENKYLPRFYETKLRDDINAWSNAVKKLLGRQPVMRGIRGTQLKSRGMYEVISADDLPNWIAEGWEQRDPSFDPKTSTETVVWRDYTREEREKMGEIRDAMFRFVMGYNASQRDIALGRLYEELARDYASPAPQEGYVRVPDTEIEGTMASRYGALSGMYVPKEIFDHLVANDEALANGVLKIYRAALRKWKEGKTVLNPVSHANNIISNLTMAHFAGVSYWDGQKYAGAIRDLVKNDPMVKEAQDVGLFGGTFNQSELVDSMPPELRALANKTESQAAKIGEGIWDLLAYSASYKGKKYGVRPVMQWAYDAEDQFFRYLIYRDARQKGLDPEDAREYSQQFIFTYDDLPAGARALRDYGMPFFSYTYKVVPVLARTALEYPWRYAAPAAVAYAANAMMYSMAASLGGNDDDWWGKTIARYVTDPEFRKKVKDMEAEERRKLPEWMKGHSAILATPKAIRMGVDEATGLPLFLDISRIFPGGDLLDANNNSGGVALLQPLTPSNPVLTTLVAMLANKDMFYGKDVVKASDTEAEKARKRADWLWKQITPAISVGNYHFDRGMNVLANMTGKPITIDAGPMGVVDYTGVGKDGLPVQPKYALAQTFGIKVRPYDLEISERIEEANKTKLIKEISAEISRLNRLESKGAVSPEAAEKLREEARVKRARLKEGLTVEGKEKD